jgi:hypothetical protein
MPDSGGDRHSVAPDTEHLAGKLVFNRPVAYRIGDSFQVSASFFDRGFVSLSMVLAGRSKISWAGGGSFFISFSGLEAWDGGSGRRKALQPHGSISRI